MHKVTGSRSPNSRLYSFSIAFIMTFSFPSLARTQTTLVTQTAHISARANVNGIEEYRIDEVNDPNRNVAVRSQAWWDHQPTEQQPWWTWGHAIAHGNVDAGPLAGTDRILLNLCAYSRTECSPNNCAGGAASSGSSGSFTVHTGANTNQQALLTITTKYNNGCDSNRLHCFGDCGFGGANLNVWGPGVNSSIQYSECRDGCGPVDTRSQSILVRNDDQLTFAAGVSGTSSTNGALNACIGIEISIQQLSDLPVTIKSAQMEHHVLKVGVEPEFSDDPDTLKTLTVEVNINGQTVNAEPIASSALTGKRTHYVSIDLADKHVPKFTDNTFPEIVVNVSENGHEGTARAKMGIFLPTIFVPGIHPLEKFQPLPNYNKLISGLVTSSELLLRDHDYLGEGYTTDTQSAYPTLFTLYYDYNKDSLTQAAKRLANYVTLVLGTTYATKVNLIGYSKGGLVSRQYLVGNPDAGLPAGAGNVRRLIMAVVPNLGAVAAAWDYLYGNVYHNLYPVWPWVRENVNDSFDVKPENPQLTSLNSRQLPDGVQYVSLYSKVDSGTLVTRTRAKKEYQFTWDYGDGVVPAFSQLGLMVDPNNPDAAAQLLPGFENVFVIRIDDYHIWYMNNDRVIDEIYGLIAFPNFWSNDIDE